METDALTLKLYTKPAVGTSKQLANLIRISEPMMKFIPEKCKITRLPRSFLFTLIHEIAPEIYESLKKSINEREFSNQFKKLAETKIKLDINLLKELDAIPEKDVNIFFKIFSGRSDRLNQTLLELRKKELFMKV